ncbi:DAR GTPase 3, chloroplastic-like [Durio zibethinus]|uniref:DAR GTPase 3, chloroplastic-like n=1 Tax=Durio zibethinus TaxID=66656 RepID=A0A6P6A4S3_DURZI|nr:DAR GTPase 3, chloroplastic-like [Durio zibethinus]
MLIFTTGPGNSVQSRYGVFWQMVWWYPGHIAKTEKELKEQFKLMDVVMEVRDARIPLSTTHPQMDLWLGNRKKGLVLNREDMISTADRNAWAIYFSRQGTKVVFSNGQLGMGTMKLGRLAKSLAAGVNVKRKAKGLLPCLVAFAAILACLFFHS